ncbi:hypothetical protein ARMGADRAFT_1030788 [Armillaria gallica]|uniref:Uncharacterized protein n=1 Tax=Armillaria gallica TaxID=47427 RepID=A0A2H3DNR9_ARMGA|nr:hypothetical protein ARMGADRAFT_1030788 [Armillaria gallica]
MSEESKNVFMDLRNSHLHDGSGPILGVVRTNGYGLGMSPKMRLLIVSDACYSTIEGTEKLLESTLDNSVCQTPILRAARDIEEGEVIFTTYTGILWSALALRHQVKSDLIRAAVLNRPCVIVPMMRDAGARPDAWIDPAVQTHNDEKKALA